jgi:hypothetical protein
METPELNSLDFGKGVIVSTLFFPFQALFQKVGRTAWFGRNIASLNYDVGENEA